MNNRHKWFFLILCGFFILIYIAYVSLKLDRQIFGSDPVPKYSVTPQVSTSATKLKTKYILQWTSERTSPFVYMGRGRSAFFAEHCSITECFVTHDRDLLGDVAAFDAIAFSGTEMRADDLPARRSPHQKYAFGTIESAANYPVCDPVFDDFFNWTWTYRLDSDSRWGYFTIVDTNGTIVGPRGDMHWANTSEEIDRELSDRLATKTKAAAWFVSNCRTQSGREKFVDELRKSLEPSGLTVDVFGKCGKPGCDRDAAACREKLARDYYFYLSFENSISEDYVTEKLLNALNGDAVPVVYGGANYTRFLPPGSYLDARALGPDNLARAMTDAIGDPRRYREFFRYRRHYRYVFKNSRPDTNDYCGFCALLHDEAKVREVSVYRKFRDWWNDPGRC